MQRALPIAIITSSYIVTVWWTEMRVPALLELGTGQCVRSAHGTDAGASAGSWKSARPHGCSCCRRRATRLHRARTKAERNTYLDHQLQGAQRYPTTRLERPEGVGRGQMTAFIERCAIRRTSPGAWRTLSSRPGAIVRLFDCQIVRERTRCRNS